MKKLICTDYVYNLEGVETFGSYLGKKIASNKTILKQWRKNDSLLGYSLKKDSLRLLGSYVSKWNSK